MRFFDYGPVNSNSCDGTQLTERLNGVPPLLPWVVAWTPASFKRQSVNIRPTFGMQHLGRRRTSKSWTNPGYKTWFILRLPLPIRPLKLPMPKRPLRMPLPKKPAQQCMTSAASSVFFFELRGNVPKWRRFLADNPSFIFYCCLIVYVLYIYPRCLCIAAQCLSSSDNDTEFQRCMSIIWRRTNTVLGGPGIPLYTTYQREELPHAYVIDN